MFMNRRRFKAFTDNHNAIAGHGFRSDAAMGGNMVASRNSLLPQALPVPVKE
jgi:hypothetical protein